MPQTNFKSHYQGVEKWCIGDEWDMTTCYSRKDNMHWKNIVWGSNTRSRTKQSRRFLQIKHKILYCVHPLKFTSKKYPVLWYWNWKQMIKDWRKPSNLFATFRRVHLPISCTFKELVDKISYNISNINILL